MKRKLESILFTLAAVAAVSSLALLSPSAALAEGSGGITGAAFYVDGVLYRTVATPAILPGNAPEESYDVIYAVGQCQDHNVATAAPGDADYNGGRWLVHAIAFDDCEAALAFDANGSGDLDSADELFDALDSGVAWDLGIVISFECPVIPLARGGH